MELKLLRTPLFQHEFRLNTTFTSSRRTIPRRTFCVLLQVYCIACNFCNFLRIFIAVLLPVSISGIPSLSCKINSIVTNIRNFSARISSIDIWTILLFYLCMESTVESNKSLCVKSCWMLPSNIVTCDVNFIKTLQLYNIPIPIAISKHLIY